MFEDIMIDEMYVGGMLLLLLYYVEYAYEFLWEGARNPPAETQRMNWGEHRDRLISRGTFHRTYRMSPESFAKLVSLLEGVSQVDEAQAYVRSIAGPIITEVCLHCVLRYLAGGSYLDICALANIPQATFYYVVWRTCELINTIPELAFRMPHTLAECVAASAGFESISTMGIMYGCIGVIDGWLCPIEVPPSRFVGNVRSFFSGHYQRYGLNVQAISDHLGRFIYMAVAAAGGQPDINALRRTCIQGFLASLPLGFFIIGDNAYPPSEYLIPVFGGAARLNLDNDNCNYYLSQCRIRIEMAFGMMTNRFGLLRSPLRISPLHVKTLMQTVARLHNYCLNENNNYETATYDEATSTAATATGGAGGGRAAVAGGEVVVETSGRVVTPIMGVSLMRERLVERVREAGLARPSI